ncbi:Uncharacterized protein FKW44_017849, partial [Caligus rogercresseyi]
TPRSKFLRTYIIGSIQEALLRLLLNFAVCHPKRRKYAVRLSIPFSRRELYVPLAHRGQHLCTLMVGDYRALNAKTIPDKYPLPHMNDIATRLHGSKIFSKVDLCQAYYNTTLHE